MAGAGDAFPRGGGELRVEFDAQPVPREPFGGDRGGAAAHEGVED